MRWDRWTARSLFLTFAAAALADRSLIALAGNIAAFALGAAVTVTALVIPMRATT